MSNMHRGNTSGYRLLRDEEQEVPTVSWRSFYVHLAGKTNGAHLGWVEKFRFIGQTEVRSPTESDYILVFCPIVSRVGTDIGEALESTEARFPGAKPIILVVMHHTFNRDHVIAESRRLVRKQNICLTVDCLFHESKLLKCNCNDAAWSEVKNFLGVSQNTGNSIWQRCCFLLTYVRNYPFKNTGISMLYKWFMSFWQMFLSWLTYVRNYPFKNTGISMLYIWFMSFWQMFLSWLTYVRNYPFKNTGISMLYKWFMSFWQMFLSWLTYAWNHPIEAVVALVCAAMTFVGTMWRKYVMADNSQRNHQSQ